MAINMQNLAAVLSALGGASERRLSRRLNRRPTFGQTLSQALAGGLGAVPGQAIGSYVGGQIDLSNRRALVGEERAYQDQPVDDPFNPLGAPGPRWARGARLADTLAGGRAAEERAFTTREREAEQAFTLERDRTQGEIENPLLDLYPSDYPAIGIPAPLLPGPGGNEKQRAFTEELLGPINEARGAGPRQMRQDAFEARAKFRGDLGTRAERERHNRETETASGDRIALQDRIARIRAEARGLDPRLLIARLGNAERAIAQARADMSKFATESRYLDDEGVRVERARLQQTLDAAMDEKDALQPLVEGFGGASAPPPAAPPATRPGGVAPPFSGASEALEDKVADGTATPEEEAEYRRLVEGGR